MAKEFKRHDEQDDTYTGACKHTTGFDVPGTGDEA
jgi:hypothetical protein